MLGVARIPLISLPRLCVNCVCCVPQGFLGFVAVLLSVALLSGLLSFAALLLSDAQRCLAQGIQRMLSAC